MYARIYETMDRVLRLVIYDENKNIFFSCDVKSHSEARRICAKYGAEPRF